MRYTIIDQIKEVIEEKYKGFWFEDSEMIKICAVDCVVNNNITVDAYLYVIDNLISKITKENIVGYSKIIGFMASEGMSKETIVKYLA